MDALVPQLVRAVLDRIDVGQLVGEYVDLDRIAARLDVDEVVARVDLDRLVDRVDLDRAAARVDLDAVVDRLDLDQLADRINLDRAVARVDLRVDLDAILDRLDLDRLADRIDLDRAAARLDLDPLLDRADLVGLARYIVEAIDLPGIIRSSTGSLGSDMVRGVRAQGADADEAVQRAVDRLLRRRRPRGGPALTESADDRR